MESDSSFIILQDTNTSENTSQATSPNNSIFQDTSSDNLNSIIGVKNPRSIVHEHFTLDNNLNKYKCNHCDKTYQVAKDGSTSSLRKHLQFKHKELFMSVDQMADALNNLEITDSFEFSQELFRNDLLHWIITDDQPFTTIENIFFQKMIKRLNSKANIPSADTIYNNLTKLFKNEKEYIQQEFQKISGKFSFTLDCWTSKNQISFLGITIHWITKDWKLQSTVLDFCHIEGPHSGENLAFKLFEVLKEFGLLTKILGISSDNASNMDKMFSKFEALCEYEEISFDTKNQRVRCLAHIINLAVQEILKSLKEEAPNNENEILERNNFTNTNGIISKLRKLVTKIRSSPQRRERLKQQCIVLDVKPLQPISDIKTRWDSTYNMIERAIFLREPLNYLASPDKELSSYLLTDTEWIKLKKIQDLLECFQKATLEMSFARFSTLGQSVPIYNYLIDMIEDFIEKNANSDLQDIINAANKAKIKLQKYYPSSDELVYVIATIMDPRHKMQYYEDNEFEETYINTYKDQITELWKKEYQSKTNESNNQTNIQNNSLKAHMFRKRKVTYNDELEVYLNEPPVNFDIDVLTFWKSYENQYPYLSKMAKDFLAIPGTSVPVERVFSKGTDLISQKRCSLDSETIKMCMCLKAWLKFKNEN